MIDDSKPRKGAATIKVVKKNSHRCFGYTVSGSQPTTNLLDFSRSVSEVDTNVHQGLHSLNTTTLLYIQQRFGLVASLTQLLCQVENDELESPPAAEEIVEETKPTKVPSLFKSLKGHTPTKEPKGKPLQETVSKKKKTWCDLYKELLECYNQYSPLKAYIESRVSPFEEILNFHLVGKKVGEQSIYNRHPSVADVGLAFAQSEVLYSAASYSLQKLARNRKFQRALELLSSEPLASCAEDSYLVSLKQTILRIIYLSLLKKGDIPNPVSLLARLDDPNLCARLALQSLRRWPIATCIDVLSMCSGRLPMNSALLNVVNKELKRMKIYSEVCTFRSIVC